MQTFTATEVKNKTGLILDMSQRQPVSIKKQGRPFAVILSNEAYEALEDAYWVLQAKKGSDSGWLSPEETEKTLKELCKNAKARLKQKK